MQILPDWQRPVEAEPEETVSDTEDGGISLDPSAEPPRTSLESNQLESTSVTAQAFPTAHEANNDRQFGWMQGQQSSYNMKFDPKLSALPTVKLPPCTHSLGDLVSVSEQFTPIGALAKYPYNFVNRNLMQGIASTFFDQNKFWTREWDLYYVWDTERDQALILVTERQFEDLLKEINSVLKLNLKITDQQREEGLVSRFPDHPLCRPRYLGRSRSKDEYNDLLDMIPSTSFRAAGESTMPPPSSGTLEDFRAMMEELWEIQKGKTKMAKKKKQQERILKQQSMSDQFKRVQRYLGLRPTAQDGTVPQGMPGAIDHSVPVPFTFDRSVVFVCVDVESYEKAHDKITEVGVATLDTRDLEGVAPGKDGEGWRPKIRARHFRIEQYKHLINRDFVHGCPDRFDFGTSEFVRLEEAAAKVGTCFISPFCARSQEGAEDEFVALMKNIDLGEQRNIIFLGHDTNSDVRYLTNLGFNPLDLPNLLEMQDTATMYRVWRREPQSTSLGKILYDFDIPGFNLHNAGNDAVFTIQSMLAICVREATIRGTPQLETMHNEDQVARLASLTEEAQQRAKEVEESWNGLDENTDGGAPDRNVVKDQVPKPTSTPPHLRGKTHGAVAFNTSSPPRGRGRGRGDGSSQTTGIPARGDGYQHGGGYGSSESYRGRSQDGYRPRGHTHTQSAEHGRSQDVYRPRGHPHAQSAERGYRGRGRSRGAPHEGPTRARGPSQNRYGSDIGTGVWGPN